jgi:hypothetical protein
MLGWVTGDGGRAVGTLGPRLLAAALLVSAEAGAIATQPGSQVQLPRPVAQGEWNLVTQSWGFSREVQVNRDFDGMDVNQQNLHYRDFYPTFEDGDAITLQGMFKWQGEAIDPTLDATAAPGAFIPRCALSVELLLAGSERREAAAGRGKARMTQARSWPCSSPPRRFGHAGGVQASAGVRARRGRPKASLRW